VTTADVQLHVSKAGAITALALIPEPEANNSLEKTTLRVWKKHAASRGFLAAASACVRMCVQDTEEKDNEKDTDEKAVQTEPPPYVHSLRSLVTSLPE